MHISQLFLGLTMLSLSIAMPNHHTPHADPNNTIPTPCNPTPLTMRETLLQTAKNYISSFNNPGDDLLGVIAFRTPNCTQRLLPSSQGVDQPMSNEEYLSFARRGQKFLTGLHLFITAGQVPIVDEEARVVVLPLSSVGEPVHVGFGVYRNQYVITLAMTDDGSLIREITEFVDSQYTARWLAFVGAMSLVRE